MKHKIVQMLNMTQTDEAQWNFCLQNQVSITFLGAISFGSLFEDTVNLKIPFSRGIIWPLFTYSFNVH